MVKQTKPYGRAASASDNARGRPPAPNQTPPKDPLLVLDLNELIAQGQDNVSAPDSAFDESGSPTTQHQSDAVSISLASSLREPESRSLVSTVVRRSGAIIGLLALGLILYVPIRDSMTVGSFTDVTNATDATMVCVDGTVTYEGFDLIDRILGNGAFNCSDWRMTKRYTILPR